MTRASWLSVTHVTTQAMRLSLEHKRKRSRRLQEINANTKLETFADPVTNPGHERETEIEL